MTAERGVSFFFLVFNSNWADVFVKLKLKPRFKNPGSATAIQKKLSTEKYTHKSLP